MDVYDELGVTKVVNGYATLTRLGGSLMPPEVLTAMTEAGRHFVDMDELQTKASERIAAWTRNEAAFVCCGAAAGLALSTAACITGLDEEKRASLPYTEGMKNEIIIHRYGDVHYAFAIRQAGGRLVQIGTEGGTTSAEMDDAITDRTAAIFYFYKPTTNAGQVPLESGIEIARQAGIPVVVDAAAQIPPVDSLWSFTQMGADLVIFSGGKGLRGPQSSGLIVGRKELIDACAFNACPRNFIGRPMKVGKEELVGLMTAVRCYLDLDHDQLKQTYEDQVQTVIGAFADHPYISARRSFPSEAGQPMPRAEIVFDEAGLGITRDEVLRQLVSGDPCIELAEAGDSGVFVNPQTLQTGQEVFIVARIREIVTP